MGGTGQVGDPRVTAQLLLAPTLWERGGTFFSCRFLSPLPLSFSEARIWLKNFFMVIYGREPRWGSSQQRSGAAARPYLGFLHGTGGLGARSPPHFISLLKASLPASRTTLPDPLSPLHCSISVQGCQSLGTAQLRARLCLLHAFSSSAWGQIFFQNAWLSPRGAGFVSDGQVRMGPERGDSAPQSSWGSTGYWDQFLCRGFGVLAATCR